MPGDNLTNTGDQPYAPVNRCIYCRTTLPPFTDEHIIPEGLGGKKVLPKSTCIVCQAKTGASENVLGELMNPLRALMGIKGKTRRKQEIQLRGKDSIGKSYSKYLRPDEVGLLAIFPSMIDPPRVLTGKPRSPQVDMAYDFFYNPDKLTYANLPGSFMLVNPLAFARMIAKIAHAQAVASFGLDGFEPFLTGLICGKDENWPDWIGQSLGNIEPVEGDPHISLKLCRLNPPHGAILLGRMVFFPAFDGGVAYDVAIGRLSESSIVFLDRLSANSSN